MVQCFSFDIGTPPTDPEGHEECDDDDAEEETAVQDPWVVEGSWEALKTSLAKAQEDDEPTTAFYISTPPSELEDEEAVGADGSKEEQEKLRKRRERRRLCNVLWAGLRALAVPDGPRCLCAADHRLLQLNIVSVEMLHALLSDSESEQRAELAASGQRPFLEIDLKELLEQVERALQDGDSCSHSCPPRHVGDGTREGELAARQRWLCDLLWTARPLWSPNDLLHAEQKLASLGIHDANALDRALAAGLNGQLRRAGLKIFCKQTITALQHCLDEAFGRTKEPHGVQKEDAWMHSGAYESGLCDVLWECRPDWSAQDLQRSVRKLKIVGITSTSTLAAALSAGLNKPLREAGLKPFSSETIRELKQRLRVAPPPRRKLSKLGRAADGGDAAAAAAGTSPLAAAASNSLVGRR